MQPFVITRPTDDAAQVPFQIPLSDSETLEFSLTRMQYIDETTMRKMRDELKHIDDLVQVTDLQGELLWQRGEDGEEVLDEEGHRMPLMSVPQRSSHERTRLVAETMLKFIVPAATFKKLQKLTVGELDQICAHWTRVSQSPLEGASQGESSASSSS